MEFKVGDRVRVIDNGEKDCFGLVGTIERTTMDFMGTLYYEVNIGKELPYAFWENQLELYEEKAKEDEIVEKTLNKFGVTMNDLKNNDLLCLSLVALLFSQDGAKIFKEIWEERKRNNGI